MFLAIQIGKRVPILGSAISAILIGFIIRHTPIFIHLDKSINSFATRYMLKGGIVLLGFTLSLNVVSKVGIEVLIVLSGEILVSILVAIIVNKILKIDHKLALLLGI